MTENPQGGDDERELFGQKISLISGKKAVRLGESEALRQDSEDLREIQNMPGGAEYYYGEYLPQIQRGLDDVLKAGRKDFLSAVKESSREEYKEVDRERRRLKLFTMLHGDVIDDLNAFVPLIESLRTLEELQKEISGEKIPDYKTTDIAEKAKKMGEFAKKKREKLAPIVADITEMEAQLDRLKKSVGPKAIRPLVRLAADPEDELERAEQEYLEQQQAKLDQLDDESYPQPVDIDGVEGEMKIEEITPAFFKELRAIGKGGMGIIYEAIPHDEKKFPRIVLKVPFPEHKKFAAQEVEMGRAILKTAKEKAQEKIRTDDFLAADIEEVERKMKDNPEEARRKTARMKEAYEALKGDEGAQKQLSEEMMRALNKKMERMLIASRMMKVGPEGFFGLPVGTEVEVMPLGSGSESGDYLDRFARNEREERTCEILIEICKMVQMCHDAGVLHRDIKPENFWIDENESGETLAKLADFGLARMKDKKGPESKGSIVGSPTYMSPETAMGKQDERADVFALGVSLYTMLSGDYAPYAGMSPMDILIQRANGTDFVMSKKNPNLRPGNDRSPIPAELRELILKTTATNPDDRTMTAGEMADVLTNYLVGKKGGLMGSADIVQATDDLFSEWETEEEAKPAKSGDQESGRRSFKIEDIEELLARGKKLKQQKKSDEATTVVRPAESTEVANQQTSPGPESDQQVEETDPKNKEASEQNDWDDVVGWMEDL